jgi:hypothetical protein
MLLDYFGLWYRSLTAGSAGGAAKPRIPNVVVLEYAGKEYRVPVSEVASFLASITPEPAIRKIQKKRVRKNKKSQYQPVVKLLDSPDEETEHIQAAIDRTNETIYRIWQRLLERKALEREDEEILLLLGA